MKNATVAIVGGGFSGTLAAIRLLTSSQRGGPSLPFGSRIVLIEPGRAGEGLAYRAGPDYWRLNVPAGRMSAFPERPDDFLAYAQSRDPLVASGDFLPRSWYGDYLSDRLELARRRSPRWLSFERIRARATAIEVGRANACIALTDGGVIEAGRVLLALGNSPVAAPLPGAADIVNDAWNLDWIEDLSSYVPRVLLVGTGLTMIDTALAIAEQRPDARMTAISRHGLLPRLYEDDAGTAPSKKALARVPRRRKFDVTQLARGPVSQRLKLFRARVKAADGQWRAPFQQVREAMPAIWRAAPRRLRRRFLRHLRAIWDVHRHRVSRAVLARVESLRARQRLEVRAGRILEARRVKDGIVVSWRPRGGDAVREELFDAVVNVTGPDAEPARSACPLVQSLVEQGLCEPDGLGLGWGTDPDGRLIDAKGNPSPVLFYVGPLLRARHWEAIAVPELRVHVTRTTAAIARSLGSGAGSYLRRIATPIFRRAQPTF